MEVLDDICRLRPWIILHEIAGQRSVAIIIEAPSVNPQSLLQSHGPSETYLVKIFLCFGLSRLVALVKDPLMLQLPRTLPKPRTSVVNS